MEEYARKGNDQGWALIRSMPDSQGTSRETRGRIIGGEVGEVMGMLWKDHVSVIARTLAFTRTETGTHCKIWSVAAARSDLHLTKTTLAVDRMEGGREKVWVERPGVRPHPAFQEEDDGGLARVAAAKMQRREWTCEGREELIRMIPRFGAQETKLTSVQSHPCLLGRQALKACSYSQGLKTNLREIICLQSSDMFLFFP